MPARRTVKPAADPTRRARRIYRKLLKLHPDAKCALEHRNAYELLVATILSAQCTDERVNMTTPKLFGRYPDAAALARSRQADVEKMIKSCGFFRNKTKSIRGAAKVMVGEHDGQVPRTMDELLELPGVARKTANVILGNAYDINEGVVVDTHVNRLSNRMGLTKQKQPEKIEQDLMQLFERKTWTMLAHLLIWHGRRVCGARKPDCEGCAIAGDCPRVGVR